MLLGPGRRKGHDRHLRFRRDRHEALRRLQRLLVNEALGHHCLPTPHLDIPGEARTVRCLTVVVLAGQDSTGEGRVGNQAHALMTTSLGEFILEAPIEQTEIVLNRLVARHAKSTGSLETLHQSPARLVAATDDSPLSGAHEPVEGLDGLVVGDPVIGPMCLIQIDIVGAQALETRLDRPNILNSFSTGGYLLYRFSDQMGEPRHKVSLDGRTNVNDRDVLLASFEAMNGTSRWGDILAKVQPKTIVWRADNVFSSLLRESDEWCEVHANDWSVFLNYDIWAKQFSNLSAINCRLAKR